MKYLRPLAALLLAVLLLPLALAVEQAPQYPPINANSVARVSTAQVIAANWDVGEWTRLQLGSGMTTAQASGNATIATGTTANAETVFRLPRQFAGPFTLRGKVTLSQRIANNNFFIEAVDLIGDGMDCLINGTTSITLTLPTKYPSLTAADVGKSFTVGVVSGAAGVPGRYPIASVDATGRLVNLTVSGWPASGTCTVSAWGLSAYRLLYDSTTATNVKLDAYRNGWGSGDTTLTINTTASGHAFSMTADGISTGYLDAAANSVSWTQRGQRTERMPDPNTTLVIQVRALNGTTNPASTTTFTLGELVVERLSPIGVTVQTQRGLGAIDGPQSVNVVGNTSSNASTNVAQINGVTPLMGNGTTGTGSLRVTLASDFTTNTNPFLVGGTGATSIGKAEDAVAASADTGVPVWAVRRDAATQSASAAADYSEITANRFGALYTAGFRTHVKTYSATHNITVAASATDIAWLPGNGTTTVQVTKVRISGIQTTSGTPEVLLIVRSTANSGGTSTSFSVAKHEQADAANSSTPIGYTVNPTPGTSAGTLRRQYLPVGAAASGLSGEVVFELGENGKPIVLSGTTQGLAINLNGVTVTGGVFNMSIEWVEF